MSSPLPPKSNRCTIFAKTDGERPQVAGRFSFTRNTSRAVQVAWAVMDLNTESTQYVVMAGGDVLAKSFGNRWEIYA